MSKTMHLLAHASTGYGPLGDQTGRELSIRRFYNAASSGGWGRLWRFKDAYAAYADKMAEMQCAGVLNGHYGYSQSRRGTAFCIAAAREMGMRYDTESRKFVDGNGEHDYSDSYMEDKWAALDVTKLRPWFVDEEAASDCSSLTNVSFSIATGIWYHKGLSLERTTVYYGDTRPNRQIRFSRSANQFYRNFCSGAWTSPTSVNALYLHPYPCAEEVTYALPVEEVYKNPPASFAGKTVTMHDVSFRLGGNSSTYTPRRGYVYDSESRSGKDENGNWIYANLYRYRWEPFMDEYIAAVDRQSLLKAVWGENGELMGYATENGTMLSEAIDLCATWDNNPTVDGRRCVSINTPYGREGEPYAAWAGDSTAKRYVLTDGQPDIFTPYWDMDESRTLSDTSKTSSVIPNFADGTFKKTTTRELRYKQGYNAATDAVFQTGDRFQSVTVDGLKCYVISGKHDFVWVVASGDASDDLLFPFCTVQVVSVMGGNTFYYQNVAHYLPVSESRYENASVKIESTGRLYRLWKIRNASGAVTDRYVQAWEMDGVAVLPEDDDDDDGKTVFRTLWYHYGNGAFALSDPPFDEESRDDTDEPEEGDIPDGGIIKSRMAIINSDANLKRGDILCTRTWSEGNRSGGHVGMYV